MNRIVFKQLGSVVECSKIFETFTLKVLRVKEARAVRAFIKKFPNAKNILIIREGDYVQITGTIERLYKDGKLF